MIWMKLYFIQTQRKRKWEFYLFLMMVTPGKEYTLLSLLVLEKVVKKWKIGDIPAWWVTLESVSFYG